MHALSRTILCLWGTFHIAESWMILPTTHHHQATLLFSSSSQASEQPIVVAATREQGKNEQLMKGIRAIHLNPVELPCIAHADGPDFSSLQETLETNPWDYVTITSPEAARVLSSAWQHCTWQTTPPPAVVAVGKATEDALQASGITVTFCPSKATAEVLVQELPLPSSQQPRVLYPASVRAQTTLQDGLTQRGFTVVRLNTYDTVTAQWNEHETNMAAQVQIACFASPSAVKGWLLNTENNHQVLAACIGETSAKACRERGWNEEHIFYPDKPGMEGWVDAVAEAAASLATTQQTR
ncbi:uroporphyrinogen-III synthase [Fistulifera solaris]|uniref:Uroporphyrinogen-III synthase n=1 Tax=Fistulifera solaris TaxID=1519565 RepID=A0A1Z5JNA0_FISSO|nr:uroporphyrinogen-III synthase [Fistulifera solaris]|eukprot:GAX15503.1 uroporphyrinogen-III synthase [Fistulifera solaris]